MANIIELQNGKTKVLRGRNGGHGRTYHSDKVYGQLARQRKLEDILLGDLLDSVNGSDNGCPDDVPAAAQLCPVADEPKPQDGVVSFFNDDCYHTLVYRDGKLASAHCQHIGHIADTSLIDLAPRPQRRR